MLFTFEYPRFFRMPIARLLRLPRRQYRKIGVSPEIDRLNLSITESGMFTAPGMRPEEYSSFSLTSIRRAPSVCLYSDRPLVISDLKNILQSYLTLSVPASRKTPDRKTTPDTLYSLLARTEDVACFSQQKLIKSGCFQNLANLFTDTRHLEPALILQRLVHY